MQAPPTLLYFDDEQGAALGLAQAAGLVPAPVQRHRFPDGEIRLRLPDALPERVVLLRTLDHPNEKLVDLLLAARTARLLGARHLTLVAPYLAYMRQDIAFVPGEAISQRIVGRFLAELFDAVVTVDPHAAGGGTRRSGRGAQRRPAAGRSDRAAAPRRLAGGAGQ